MGEAEIRAFVASLLAPLETKIRAQEQAISALEEKAEDVRVWQAKYGERIDTICDLVKNLSDKPQKRWDAVIAAIIAAVISGAVTLLLR